MSGVLHPVGPEPAGTYWVRRAIVLGVLAVIVAIVIGLIGHGTGGPRTIAAAPASTTSSATPTAPTVTPSAAGMATVAPASPSLSVTSPAMSSSAAPRSSPTARNKKKISASPSARATKVQPSRCGPGQLRPTLTGKQLLKPKQVNTFSLSLMNTGAATCLVDVTAANFELKIYSGRDRIWSSDDCSTSVKTIHQNLSTQKSVNWQLAWNGRRSRKDCQSRMEIPKAGTYFATAQLLGAKPVQLRMILRS